MKWIILLVSFNVYAQVFIPESNIGVCPMADSVTKEKNCTEACAMVQFDYKCDTHIAEPIMVEDLTKPLYSSRSMIEPCEGREACYEKLIVKTCIEPRTPIQSDTEVWCAEFLGYEMKDSGRKKVVEDPIKKAAYMEKLLAEKQVEALKAKGARNRALTQEALNFIGGMYDDQPEESTDSLLVEYAEIYQALVAGRRGRALRLTQSKEVTGAELILKNELIKILTRE